MTAEPVTLDEAWLNDRSEYQRNWVHGLRNPSGLHLQYRLERVGPGAVPPPPDPDPLAGHRVVADWVPEEHREGFPGVVHGGLLVAVLDDVIGRCAALRHRWVVTGRLDCRFRSAAPVGVSLRIESWLTRWQRRAVTGVARVLLPDGTVVVEAEGTYLPITGPLLERMLEAWPGFADYVE